MNADISEQIADYIHGSFKYGNSTLPGIPGIIEASQLSGSVRKELMMCAARLKQHDVDNDLLSKVEANVRTANVTGLVTDDTR